MSDWEFLYEMKALGYSEDAIQEAMSSGAAPWEWDWIEKQEQKQPQKGKRLEKSPSLLQRKEDRIPVVFRTLLDIMKELHNGKQDWIAFANINSALRKQGVRIEEYQYKKFKLLMLEAEQRGLVKIRQKGQQWDAKLS